MAKKIKKLDLVDETPFFDLLSAAGVTVENTQILPVEKAEFAKGKNGIRFLVME